MYCPALWEKRSCNTGGCEAPAEEVRSESQSHAAFAKSHLENALSKVGSDKVADVIQTAQAYAKALAATREEAASDNAEPSESDDLMEGPQVTEMEVPEIADVNDEAATSILRDDLADSLDAARSYTDQELDRGGTSR